VRLYGVPHARDSTAKPSNQLLAPCW
jgi:hypothetical protein